jgi:hypothetical protein
MGRNILRKSKCHEMVPTSRNPWYSTERDINHQITGGVSNDVTVDVNDPDNVNPLIYSIRRMFVTNWSGQKKGKQHVNYLGSIQL